MRITNLEKLSLFKLGSGGLVLGLSQFLLLPLLPQKMNLSSKVVKSDSKIIISLHKSKSVTHYVADDLLMPSLIKLSIQEILVYISFRNISIALPFMSYEMCLHLLTFSFLFIKLPTYSPAQDRARDLEVWKRNS